VASERAWVIEGTASYGRGLTVMLQRRGEWVIELDRAERNAANDGAKSDALDAIRAGREALGRKRLAEPRAHSGMREAIRAHRDQGCRGAGPHRRDQRTEGARRDGRR
jgi:transposase